MIKTLHPLLLLPPQMSVEDENKDPESEQDEAFNMDAKPVIVDTEFTEIEAV